MTNEGVDLFAQVCRFWMKLLMELKGDSQLDGKYELRARICLGILPAGRYVNENKAEVELIYSRTRIRARLSV